MVGRVERQIGPVDGRTRGGRVKADGADGGERTGKWEIVRGLAVSAVGGQHQPREGHDGSVVLSLDAVAHNLLAFSKVFYSVAGRVASNTHWQFRALPSPAPGRRPLGQSRVPCV